ncbi:MAG: aldehyde dehydrogenase [Alistipes sp.]|nr:aldehyde dehydrogenase [Alistipes senegalensis]MCM1250466.1 aldehyde dehydrogenase [Alistipes sp.]
MKNGIELFAALGERLHNFGSDAPSQRIIAEACAANGWFTPEEIRRAVGAIAERMLRRETLERWLGAYPIPVAEPRRVLVVMAGNIPAVGFLDLLCVVASGHRCVVKPSTKDRILITYIVELLQEIDPEVPIEFYDGAAPVDALIATGSNNARRYFQARYAGIPALLRGNRQSVAVLSGRETPEQLAGLADDIGAYSGLGCRSVSRLFLPEGCRLQLELRPSNPKLHNDYLRTRALLTMTGRPFIDLGCAVAVEQQEFPASLSCIAYSHYRDLREVESWLTAHDEELQCVVSECVGHSRRTGFGCAQSPSPTDWPDDRDVLTWLTTNVK